MVNTENEKQLVEVNDILIGAKGFRWRVLKYLGRGSFGAVVLAENVDGGQLVAVKVEDAHQPLRTLRQEVLVLEAMNSAGAHYCCDLFDTGRKGDICNWISMTLVGESLMKLRKKTPKKRFSLLTALYLAASSLRAIEELHEVGSSYRCNWQNEVLRSKAGNFRFIHRDIKPANFSIGIAPQQRQLYILDFGMARRYRKEGGRFRGARDSPGFRGTPKYASVAALNMEEQSRRDDIYSWFFMVVEFTSGRMPWNDQQYQVYIRF
ncbi:unnamed protein product [Soboliphyme baturini]|uniref:Protein kinase domain-containing protein n=1 Tax=Soboliphyme baturini TaxID=241478 RepID=A0A183IIW4_9BILA|nr:unnamed protein product [Soboliphyme baturini]